MRKHSCVWLLIGLSLALVCGCDMDSSNDSPPVAVPRPNVGPPQETSIRGNKPPGDVPAKPYVPPFKTQPIQQFPSSVDTPQQQPEQSTSSSESFLGNDSGRLDDKTRATNGIASEIADALKLKKTLVVWLLDRGSKFNWDMIQPTSQMALAKSKNKSQLLTAVMTINKEGATKITDAPAEDLTQIANLVSGVGEERDEPKTFTAIDAAADEYLPYRAKGYEMIFVIVGDRAGQDWEQFDAAAPKLRRAAVSVFGVGKAVPFGRQAGMSDGAPCESLALERIDLQYPPPNMGQNCEANLTDSGFGPFGLERICRASHGRFYRLRVPNIEGKLSPGWTTGPNDEIDPEMLNALAPDYVSDQDYQKLLSENKARLAVHNAAKLPFTKVFRSDSVYVNTVFHTRDVNAAQVANMVSNAQRPVAEKSLDVDRMYDALAPGESERSKLTSARWQCNFDLAMGRILAAKARIDGFNALLATVKQGKSFTNAKASSFVLHRSDTIPASSVLDKMAKNSRMYLNRIIKEHPGTPWADLAARELTENVGWELKEE